MILDTSAVVAILRNEMGWERLLEAVVTAPRCRMSAGTYIELGLVLESQDGAGMLRQSEAWLREAAVEIEPVTIEQAHAARQAFHDFGKGRHAAGLNFGDCFAYALARLSGEPLLFQGDDFRRTDVVAALGPSPF